MDASDAIAQPPEPVAASAAPASETAPATDTSEAPASVAFGENDDPNDSHAAEAIAALAKKTKGTAP